MKSAILVLFLIGCASNPIMTPQRVEIPVTVPCHIDMPTKPEWPLDIIPKDAPRDIWLRAALTELNLRTAYEFGLAAAIISCVSTTTK